MDWLCRAYLSVPSASSAYRWWAGQWSYISALSPFSKNGNLHFFFSLSLVKDCCILFFISFFLFTPALKGVWERVICKYLATVSWGKVIVLGAVMFGFFWYLFYFSSGHDSLVLGFYPGSWYRKGDANPVEQARRTLSPAEQQKFLADGVCQALAVWCVWSEELSADALLLFRSCVFSSTSLLQEMNAQKHVNLQL